MTPRIHIKRVYEPAEASDGFRVLVDKLWPRGMKKENLRYDLWMKGVTPSTSLRQWFHEDIPARWPQFQKKYRKELKISAEVKEFLAQLKGKKTVTLLFASKNAMENHALILRDFLQAALQ